MRAAVLHESPGRLSVEDVTVDRPGPHEVLIQVGATGLCHSDLHYLERPYPLAGPTVLGHEGAGVVEAVGPDVTYVRPGDHVISYPSAFCGLCEFCLSGRPTICSGQAGLQRGEGQPPRLRLADGRTALQFTGLATFAEQMLVHENALVKIDPGIPLEVAALVGCGVPTGVGAVIRTAKVPAGATVAVVGCGGVGLNVLQGARLAGASRIIGIDINDGKLERARQFGATDVINNAAGDAVEQLNELLTGAGGVDYSFEALGLKQTLELACALLRPGGTATMIGVAAGSFEIPAVLLLRERKIQGSLMGSMRFRQDLPYLLGLYQQGRAPARGEALPPAAGPPVRFASDAQPREVQSVSTPAVHEYGPYTLYDLDALPEDGKRFELADGWLTELSPSPWHDHAAERLKEILKAAATQVGADVYVAGGPNDVSTPAGIRKPDVFVVPRDVARSAVSRRVRTYYASDLLLVAEVVSPRSGSERTDRVQKVGEYAKAGIPLYWIVELEPDPRVTVLTLGETSYELAAEFRAGHELSVQEPFPVSFDPVALTELD